MRGWGSIDAETSEEETILRVSPVFDTPFAPATPVCSPATGGRPAGGQPARSSPATRPDGAVCGSNPGVSNPRETLGTSHPPIGPPLRQERRKRAEKRTWPRSLDPHPQKLPPCFPKTSAGTAYTREKHPFRMRTVERQVQGGVVASVRGAEHGRTGVARMCLWGRHATRVSDLHLTDSAASEDHGEQRRKAVKSWAHRNRPGGERDSRAERRVAQIESTIGGIGVSGAAALGEDRRSFLPSNHQHNPLG